MTPKLCRELRRELKEMLKHPHNRSEKDMVSIANKVGRYRDNRGKEPTYIRMDNPKLSPPLSIPGHSGELRPLTVKSIVNTLLSDLDEWEIYMLEKDEDDNDQH